VIKILSAISRMNAEVDGREEEREEKWVVSLQPASTQKLINFVR